MELSEESSGQEQENLQFSDNTILPFGNPEPYTDDYDFSVIVAACLSIWEW